MTQEELDALPDATLGWGLKEEVIDGQLVRVPVLQGIQGALYRAPDDALLVRDIHGDYWQTGWINGVRYKRRRR